MQNPQTLVPSANHDIKRKITTQKGSLKKKKGMSILLEKALSKKVLIVVTIVLITGILLCITFLQANNGKIFSDLFALNMRQTPVGAPTSPPAMPDANMQPNASGSAPPVPGEPTISRSSVVLEEMDEYVVTHGPIFSFALFFTGLVAMALLVKYERVIIGE